ncbi:MAG: WecB/TagA/CpsF family glycosyltransferase [Cyanobacteria bacterium SIG30]|nr:WecB/TagA/CpsF family glycosyltransferase [Cyanobacteria bacterium SIG30]
MKENILIQGIKIDLVNKEEALKKVENTIKSTQNMQIVTLNPEMVIKASKQDDFKEILNKAELTIMDGVGIKIALKLKGINLENTRGIDFSYELLKLADKNNFKVGFLGTDEETLQKAVTNIKKDLKNLNIVYIQNGFFDDEEKIINDIKNVSPQILLCALGSPKQEFLNYKLKNILTNCITIGVGGSFDVWAGKVCEAPKIWQKLGLEWLYRTIKQPERFKRIFPTLPIFLFRSIIDMGRRF